MENTLTFQLLGGLEVRRGGHVVPLGSPKQRAVLSTLLLADGQPVAPARLVDLVWGADAPPGAMASLQSYVSHLRRALEPERTRRAAPTVLVSRPGGYAVDADEARVDLRAVERRLTAGLGAAAGGDRVRAQPLLRLAVDGWPELLPELDGPVVVARRAQLAELHAAAVAAHAEGEVAAGRDQTAIPALAQAVERQPRSERLRSLLALALYRAGRQADALAVVAEARRWLRDEAGLEPGPELRRLERDLLAQDPALEARRAPVGSTRSVRRIGRSDGRLTPFDRPWARPSAARTDRCLGPNHHVPARPCQRRTARV